MAAFPLRRKNQPHMTTPRRRPPSDTSAFESLHRDLMVSQIATPRDKLVTCAREEPIAAVQKRNTSGYDFLPVEDDGSIIGLFHARPFWNKPPADGIVGAKMRVLSDANLIGAEASILEFLKEVDEKPFRLVVSGGGIGGLVAWSDLQRLPVRTALFALITGFELTMFDAIKSEYPTGVDWLTTLGSERQGEVRKAIQRSQEHEGDVDALLYTQICDKATILRDRFSFRGSKKQVKRLFGRIERLRNKVAHANNYVSRRQDAIKASGTVKGLIALRAEILEQVRQRDNESGEGVYKAVIT